MDRGDGKLARIGEIAGANGVDPVRAAAALAFYREIKAAAEANAKDAAYQSGAYQNLPDCRRSPADTPIGDAGRRQDHASAQRQWQRLQWRRNSSPLLCNALEMSDVHREIYVSEQHGSLQGFDPALVNLMAF